MLKNYFKGFFTVKSTEDAIFIIFFWLFLIFGGMSLIQPVGKYVETYYSQYFLPFVCICISIIVLSVIGPLLRECFLDFKATGSIFKSRNQK